MPEIRKISKWQCLFRYHEGAVWESAVGSFKTDALLGASVNRPEIARPLAGEISRLVDAIQQHQNLQTQSRIRPTGGTGQSQTPSNEPADQDIRQQIAQLLGEDEAQVIGDPGRDTDLTHDIVHPSQIELIEVNDNSRVEGIVFPRSFICPTCGHYVLMDPNVVASLYCPCCKSYCRTCNNVDSSSDNICPNCHGPLSRSLLRQFNFVFDCPRCGRFEELTPRFLNLDELKNGPIQCPVCHVGHLHFLWTDSFSTSRWRCSDSECGHSIGVDKVCRCHVPQTNEQPGLPSIMKPTPTTSSIAVPLVRSYLWLGSEMVTLSNLEQNHEGSKETDEFSWRLKEELSTNELEMVKQLYSIDDAFSIPRIQTTTVVYGFRSGISSYPTRINENDRLAKLFTDKTRRRYRAYVANTIGRALVLRLSKDRIIDSLVSAGVIQKGSSYEQVAENCINHLSVGVFQTVVSGEGPVQLAELLHAYEHAIFKTAVAQVGLEVFGSKILIRDAAIVLYEREEIGPGGLVQLSKADQFIRLLLGTRRILWDCPQLCADACPACLFINDYYCQPYVPDEIDRWLPPNALLDRYLAQEIVRRTVGRKES